MTRPLRRGPHKLASVTMLDGDDSDDGGVSARPANSHIARLLVYSRGHPASRTRPAHVHVHVFRLS
jgi:hypothetical protein